MSAGTQVEFASWANDVWACEEGRKWREREGGWRQDLM